MPIGLVPLRSITPPHVKDNASLSRVDIVKQQFSGGTGDCHRLKSLEQTTFPYITREEKLEVFGMG